MKSCQVKKSLPSQSRVTFFTLWSRLGLVVIFTKQEWHCHLVTSVADIPIESLAWGRTMRATHLYLRGALFLFR